MSVEKYGWVIKKILFSHISQVSTFSLTRENSKIFHITFKIKFQDILAF